MTVTNDLSQWTWDPSSKGGVTIDGTAYKAPTTSYLKDKDGNIVLDKNGRPTLVTTPSPGMEGMAGKNTSGKKPSEFDGEMFLKLLVAQLKYQDPTKPTDTSALMQQTATLSMVERINAMAKSNEEMIKTYTSMLAEQRISSSVGLVGRTVVYAADPNDPDKTAEGVVESVRFDGTGPILSVGGKDVPYNDVTSVKAAVNAAPSPAPRDEAKDSASDPAGTNSSSDATDGATDSPSA